jgi:hypothetical protein
MPDREGHDRRSRSLADHLLVWLAPMSLALNLYFIRELYQDVRDMRDDIVTIKVQLASRPQPTPGGTP